MLPLPPWAPPYPCPASKAGPGPTQDEGPLPASQPPSPPAKVLPSGPHLSAAARGSGQSFAPHLWGMGKGGRGLAAGVSGLVVNKEVGVSNVPWPTWRVQPDPGPWPPGTLTTCCCTLATRAQPGISSRGKGSVHPCDPSPASPVPMGVGLLLGGLLLTGSQGDLNHVWGHWWLHHRRVLHRPRRRWEQWLERPDPAPHGDGGDGGSAPSEAANNSVSGSCAACLRLCR